MRRTHVMLFSGLALLLALPMDASAQRRRAGEASVSGGRGFFMVGAQQLDLDELNERFADTGYPEFDDVLLTLGGGGFFVHNRFVIGGEGHGALGSSETTDGDEFRTSVGGGYGLLNVGYAAIAHRGLLVYPMIGVGGGGLMVDITERSTPDFDDVLDQPRRGVHLVQAQFLVSAGIGIDHVFRTGISNRGFALGLRAGWMFAPIEGDWAFGRNDVADGPDSGFNGPYVRLSIGAGRR